MLPTNLSRSLVVARLTVTKLNPYATNSLYVSQPFPLHSPGYQGHLFWCMGIPHVVTPCKLRHIAAQVLIGKVMEGAVVPALEHGPEGLDAVGMGLVTNKLLGTVNHGLVLELKYLLIGSGLIGVERCPKLHMLLHKTLQGRGICV